MSRNVALSTSMLSKALVLVHKTTGLCHVFLLILSLCTIHAYNHIGVKFWAVVLTSGFGHKCWWLVQGERKMTETVKCLLFETVKCLRFDHKCFWINMQQRERMVAVWVGNIFLFCVPWSFWSYIFLNFCVYGYLSNTSSQVSCLCFTVANMWRCFLLLSDTSCSSHTVQLWISDCSFVQCISIAWLLHDRCHIKLLPSQRTFCVHHTTLHQFKATHIGCMHVKL